MFSIDMSPLVYALGGIAVAAGIVRYALVSRIYKNAVKATRVPAPAAPEGPRLSVVAYGSADTDQIRSFLERMELQTYTNRQIIIIIDGTARQAASMREIFAERFPDTIFSFVPPESHNLSRRKLANTIGIKAADGELILTTLTRTVPVSDQWLALMAGAFTPGTDVVLGYASMNYNRMGRKASWRCFDSLTVASRWISAAVCGHPYRGDGANLGFRRQTFFDNSGYGNNYFIHSGDDDLYVSQIASTSNTTLMVHPEAQLVEDWGESADRVWVDRKEHYRFTARMLSRHPRLKACLGALTLWLQWISWIAVGVLPMTGLHTGGNNLLGLCVAIPLLGAAVIIEAVNYNRLTEAYGALRAGIRQPFYALWQPLANIMFSIRYSSRAHKNFTYQR